MPLHTHVGVGWMEGVAGLLPPYPGAEQFFSPVDLGTIWRRYPLSEWVLHQAISAAERLGLPARWEVEYLD